MAAFCGTLEAYFLSSIHGAAAARLERDIGAAAAAGNWPGLERAISRFAAAAAVLGLVEEAAEPALRLVLAALETCLTFTQRVTAWDSCDADDETGKADLFAAVMETVPLYSQQVQVLTETVVRLAAQPAASFLEGFASQLAIWPKSR
jgi:hypothetical protein